MSNDHQLNIRLAADASELKRAQAEGAAGFERLGAAGQEAGAKAAAGGRQATGAAQAEAAAVAAAARQAAAARVAEQQAMRAQRAEANLLAQANRQLAMQMTDVVTSIASGMPVWMVAIQQGGQIKDAYGGITPALRAVVGAITPTAVALTGLAAAAALVTLGYKQGSDEFDAYVRGLAMTRNAAGTTIGQLNEMAKAVSRSGGTQGLAAEALAMAAASGRVSAENLQLVGAAAVQVQRTLGIAVEETVGNFVELGRSPVAASEKLNEQTRFLTSALYEQIRALEKQGRTAEAGALAQRAYAEGIRPGLEEVERRLGYIDRAWRAVGDATKWALDQARNVGRPETPEEELAKLRERRGSRPLFGGYERMNSSIREAKQISDFREEALARQIKTANEAAAAEGKAQQAAEEAIKNAARREAESKAIAASRVQQVKDALQAETDAYASAGQLLETYRGAGLLTEESYYGAKRALIAANARVQKQALEAESRALQAQTLYGAEAINRDAQVAHNRAQMAAISAKAAADVGLANVQERLSLEALSRAQVEYSIALERANAQRALANGRDLAGARSGDQARSAAGRMAGIADRYNSDVDQANSDRFNGRINPQQYSERLAMLREYYNAALQQEADYQDARAKLAADGTVGLDRALANYAEQSRDVARQTERMWTDAFNGMEDAIVRFAMTGKLSFKDMANSIIADLIRIWLRQQMTGLFATGLDALSFSLSGGSSGFGNGAPMGGVGGVFHGGGKVGTDAPMAMRYMPASTWDHAPRFHSGRLASDEMAAILQKDESVLTPAQMRQLGPAGGGAPVQLQLNVINQTGQAVNATARQTDGGIEVLLTAAQTAMAGDVSEGRGDMYMALKTRFNLRD